MSPRLLAWLGLLAIVPVHGEVSGRLETLGRVEDSFYREGGSLEQRVDLVYADLSKRRRAGLEFSGRVAEEDAQAELYQAYLEQTLKAVPWAVTLGRFARIDGLGFYTLDGLLLRRESETLNLEFYGGVPRRIEDYYTEQGESLFGVEAGFRHAGP